MEQFANIRDEVFEEMEVDFENIMDQESSDEEMLSTSGCVSDMNEYEIDRVEKFVQPSEIRTLNARTKHCVIHNYYTTDGALTVCTACMIRIADINDVGMYHVREHETDSFGRQMLDGKLCTNCRGPCTIFSCSMCPLCTH